MSCFNDVKFLANKANLEFIDHSFHTMPDSSDLSLERKECSKCGAVWLNGQLYWATGVKAKELDLAGLVCNQTDSEECINSKKGQKGGDTWEKRLMFLNNLDKIMEQRGTPMWDAGIYTDEN